MEKFIPYAKLSKKKKRELDKARRGGWGALNPVTRRAENPKAYNRQKARRRSFEEQPGVPFVIECFTKRRGRAIISRGRLSA